MTTTPAPPCAAARSTFCSRDACAAVTAGNDSSRVSPPRVGAPPSHEPREEGRWRSGAGLGLSTVQASAAAIAAAASRSAGRADPTKTPLVADTLRGIARQHAAAPEATPRQAAALDYASALDLMRAAAWPQRRGRARETPAAATARGRRDAAIVALAFCAGLRRSEIAALIWNDITPTAGAGLQARAPGRRRRRGTTRSGSGATPPT